MMTITKKILLFAEEQSDLARFEGTLRVAGYDLVLAHTYDGLVTTCQFSRNARRPVDVLVISACSELEEQLSDLLESELIGAVLHVGCKPAGTTPYTVIGREGWLYQDSALLAATKDLLLNAKNKKSAHA